MRYALPLVIAAVVALAACESTQKAETKPDVAMGAVNDTCPMMGEKFDQSNPPATVEYDGHTVGLCCSGCIKGWNNWDDEKKADFVASLK